MSDADFRQMQEAEEERMAHNLAALERLEKVGQAEAAKYFASELGLSNEFNRKGERHEVGR